ALVRVYDDYKNTTGFGHDTMHALGGAQRLGIEKVGGFAGRAVLLDMVSYFGNTDWVEDRRNTTGAGLEGAATKAGVEVRAGDIVLIRTGYLDGWYDAHNAGAEHQFAQA